MDLVRLSKPGRQLQADIPLDGSKSISNRALIALALAGADPERWLRRRSTSNDTQTLLRLLQSPSENYDAGDAGTTFRFLTAYLALQPGTQILTGSTRMRERPIGPLVQALRALGANIRFLEREGFPPLQIGSPNALGSSGRQVRVDAGLSSQFLSALLLIGPYLPEGLELIPEGRLVSRPYLDMTLRLMHYFGAQAGWRPGGEAIEVAPGGYTPRELVVEADWSAASYWYAMAAFADSADLRLHGLFPDSWQGDSVIADWLFPGSVHSGTALIKFDQPPELPLRQTLNFLPCPDIAQTLAVVCAGRGLCAEFSGLETLAIKETDRTAALQTELAKTGVRFSPAGAAGLWRLEGRAQWKQPPRFASYGDHRMAMAFACLAMLGPVEIENPAVVAKSYPAFWEHLAAAGFLVEKISGA